MVTEGGVKEREYWVMVCLPVLCHLFATFTPLLFWCMCVSELHMVVFFLPARDRCILFSGQAE